jgi:hypothetical protein
MIKLIVGSKGTGKTKILIDAANKAVKESKGNVVCIERGDALRFNVDHHIRLINIKEYGIRGGDAYYGFFAGLLAGNYDITDIFGDATFKILCGKDERDQDALAELVLKLDALTKNGGVCINLTISCDANDLDERIKGFIAN